MRSAALVGFLLLRFVPSTHSQISADGQTCIDCHSGSTPGIVEQWRESAHAKKSVDCYSCHRANEKDPAAFDHYGHLIAVPKR